MPRGRFSVVVVTYNGMADTVPCMDSVLPTLGPGDEAVVVDNGSGDGTREYLRSLAAREPRLKVVENAGNRGYAGGNNDGIRAASGEVLVLLNNDTRVTEGWLERLGELLRSDRSAGLVGPVSNEVGNEQKIFTRGASPEAILGEGRAFSAAGPGDFFETERLGFFCVALRRDVAESVGPLDEAFGMGFCEDDDYCLRVRKAGLRLLCAEDVFVYHRGSGSFGKDPEGTRRLVRRNRALLERKHGPYRPPHPRDRQLELVEEYLARLEAGGGGRLLEKAANRLALAETLRPKGLFRRLRFDRRLASLRERARQAGKTNRGGVH